MASHCKFVCHFPIGILGQVWYLIESSHDLCTLTYQGGRNNVCFDVNIEIMTQNCLKSRHYQEFFLKHRAWASLNADVSTYITKI